MPTITVSQTKGEGSLKHNIRDFAAGKWPDHIDQSRTQNNIVFKNIPLEVAYGRLFGEAIRKYDEGQSRADRRYGTAEKYLEKVTNSKQQEPFYETIFQFGDMFTHGFGSGKEDDAKAMLEELWQKIEARYPQIFFTQATLHLDEATPHIHADYIPVATGYKTGLNTRVGLDKALREMGFKASGKYATPLEAWQADILHLLEDIAVKHGYEVIHPMGKTEHRMINTYKRDMQELDKRIEALAVPEHIERKPAPFSGGEKVIVRAEDLDRLEQASKLVQEERNILAEIVKLWEDLKAKAEAFLKKLKGLDRIRARAESIVNGEEYKALQEELKFRENLAEDLITENFSLTEKLKNTYTQEQYEKAVSMSFSQGVKSVPSPEKAYQRGYEEGIEKHKQALADANLKEETLVDLAEHGLISFSPELDI